MASSVTSFWNRPGRFERALGYVTLKLPRLLLGVLAEFHGVTPVVRVTVAVDELSEFSCYLNIA